MNKVLELFWQYKLLIGTKIIEALGVLMLIYELLSLIDCLDAFLTTRNLKVWIFIAIVFISFGYAWYSLFRKKEVLTIDINKRTQLTIEKGDIMTVNGVRVIPVNEYFDTHLGDGIIKESSLHGQLLSMYKNRISELRILIDNQLANIEPLPSNRERTLVPGLPQNRYPLGTCVRIFIDGNCYLLVATTRFDDKEHVDVSAEEFPEVIRKMFNGIELLHDGNTVYIPLVGSGISGYELTNMQILYTIVQAAHNANRLSLTNGLHLYIYNDKQMKSINLHVVEYLYNRWITLK